MPPRNEPFARASTFFLLRTPLCPFDELRRWNDTPPEELSRSPADRRALLGRRLIAAFQQPVLREALAVASPSVHAALAARPLARSGAGDKLEPTLVKYFSRLTGRSTPFGLFAGVTAGVVGACTRLDLQAQADYRRRCSLDFDVLAGLSSQLAGREAVRRALPLRPNPAGYRVGEHFRYLEVKQLDDARTLQLSEVAYDEGLAATLVRAEGGATPDELAAHLRVLDEQLGAAETRAYIAFLADQGVLVSDLQPRVTGRPLRGLVETLRRALGDGAPIVEHLAAADRVIGALDGSALSEDVTGRYAELARELECLPVTAKRAMVHVELWKPPAEVSLSTSLVEELGRGAELLFRICDVGERRNDHLIAFCDRFREHYGDSEVSLLEALDPEHGIGFALNTGVQIHGASPVLADLALEPPKRESLTGSSARHALLLGKLAGALAGHEREILLAERDVAALEVEPADRRHWPRSFSVMATLLARSPEAVDRGDYALQLHGVTVDGGRLLARFAAGEAELTSALSAYLRDEEALRPGVIHAEIVHPPPHRGVGNALVRPVLRPFELPLGGTSSVDEDHQIAPAELTVRVDEQGHVRLHSRRLDVEVLPRLTCAHAYGSEASSGIYRFLCTVARQLGPAGYFFSWGALGSAPFLPRVRTGRFILSPMQWTLGREALAAFRGAGSDAASDVEELRHRLALPRFVSLVHLDKALPIDLDNLLCVDHLAASCRRAADAGGELVLQELLDDQPIVRGPEGRFRHELIVPFLATCSAHEPAREARWSSARDVRPLAFPPGSEWLYAKLYTGEVTADRVLATVVASLARQGLDALVDRWFFIRYRDPHGHLRLRLHGTGAGFAARALEVLHAAVAPFVESREVWSVQLDTYRPEVRRYGGAAEVALSEEIFHADSVAVVGLLQALEDPPEPELRWRMAVLGCDRLLADFALPVEARLALCKRQRERWARSLDIGTEQEKQLGRTHRRLRPSLDAAFRTAAAFEGPLAACGELLDARSRRVSPVARTLAGRAAEGRLTCSLESLVESHVHMHLNRMFHTATRVQELIVYDALQRMYQSELARDATRKAP